jgi:mRNA interferase MazF
LAHGRGGRGLAQFVKGDVVVVNFPFSDLSQSKRRPALVVVVLQGDDVILCQITSQARDDDYSIWLDQGDFVSGGLNQKSKIRPNRLFTGDSGIIAYRAGHVSDDKVRETVDKLIALLNE